MVNVKTNISLADGITKFWILNNGSEILPENVYTGMSSKDIENIRGKVETSINLFNNSSGMVTPPVAKLNPLVDKYINTITFPSEFDVFEVSIDAKVDGPRVISNVEYSKDIDADCCGCRKSGNKFKTNYVSGDKQTFRVTRDNLLTDVDCLAVTSNLYEGGYKFVMEITTKPVKADGTPDNTRTDFYKSYPITFTL